MPSRGIGARGRGGENAGVAVANKYGAAGLARKLTGFDGERAPAQLHADGLWQKGILLFSCVLLFVYQLVFWHGADGPFGFDSRQGECSSGA